MKTTTVKCKECSYEGNIENFPTTMHYDQDADGNISKDSTFICPNCDAEGDEYFDIIEKILNVEPVKRSEIVCPECGTKFIESKYLPYCSEYCAHYLANY